MPCRDDYPEPSKLQSRSRQAAELLIYVYGKVGKAVPAKLRQDAKDCYCDGDYVPKLCEALSELSNKEFDRIVYNPRERQSRALADWWEEHEEMDRIREEKEAAELRRQALKKSGLAKLSAEEKEALGLK